MTKFEEIINFISNDGTFVFQTNVASNKVLSSIGVLFGCSANVCKVDIDGTYYNVVIASAKITHNTFSFGHILIEKYKITLHRLDAPVTPAPAVHDGYNPDGVDFTHYPIPAGWRLVTSEDMEKDKREYAKRGLKVFSSCGWKNVEGNNLSSFWCKFTYITKIEFPKSTLSLPPIPVGFRFATKEDLMKKKKDFKEVMYYCSDQKKWVCPISNIVTFSCDDLYIVKDK